METKVLTNAIYLYGQRNSLPAAQLLINDGVIVGFVYDTDIPDDYEVRDLGGNNIAPALIDLPDIRWETDIYFSADPSYRSN